jgi:hypothetical protein
MKTIEINGKKYVRRTYSHNYGKLIEQMAESFGNTFGKLSLQQANLFLTLTNTGFKPVYGFYGKKDELCPNAAWFTFGGSKNSEVSQINGVDVVNKIKEQNNILELVVCVNLGDDEETVIVYDAKDCEKICSYHSITKFLEKQNIEDYYVPIKIGVTENFLRREGSILFSLYQNLSEKEFDNNYYQMRALKDHAIKGELHISEITDARAIDYSMLEEIIEEDETTVIIDEFKKANEDIRDRWDIDVSTRIKDIANKYKRTPIIDPQTGQINLRNGMVGDEEKRSFEIVSNCSKYDKKTLTITHYNAYYGEYERYNIEIDTDDCEAMCMFLTPDEMDKFVSEITEFVKSFKK